MDSAVPVEDPQGMMGIMPNGTITVWGDRDVSELYLYCDPEPDPLDWKLALEIVRQYSDGQAPDEYMDEGTVVLTFRMGGLEPDLTDRQDAGSGESVPESGRRRQRRPFLASIRAMFYEPQHKAIGKVDALPGASPWPDDSQDLT